MIPQNQSKDQDIKLLERKKQRMSLTEILMAAKEVRTTKDPKKAALLLQSKIWVAVEAAFHGEDVEFVLIRIS